MLSLSEQMYGKVWSKLDKAEQRAVRLAVKKVSDKKLYGQRHVLQTDKIVELIKLHGGECSRCGYKKCYAALEFHHVNPDNKKFNVGISSGTRSWKALCEEAAKCILLCSNCHREEHHPNKKPTGLASPVG